MDNVDDDDWPSLSQITKVDVTPTGISIQIAREFSQNGHLTNLMKDWATECRLHNDTELVNTLRQQESRCGEYGRHIFNYEILLLMQIALMRGYVKLAKPTDCNACSFFGINEFLIEREHLIDFWKEIVCYPEEWQKVRNDGWLFKNNMRKSGLMPQQHSNWGNALLGMMPIVYRMPAVKTLLRKTPVGPRRKPRKRVKKTVV
jgi:hypothetical protein